jgi:hypothetical protein
MVTVNHAAMPTELLQKGRLAEGAKQVAWQDQLGWWSWALPNANTRPKDQQCLTDCAIC